MRRFVFYAAALSSLLLGCAKSSIDAAHLLNGTEPGVLTPKMAKDTSYHYAYSAQITNSATGEVVKNFNIEVASPDPMVGTIINAQGDENGIFHFSKPGTTRQLKSVPILISSPDYQPKVTTITIGTDCNSTNCSGAKPAEIFLTPAHFVDRTHKARSLTSFDTAKVEDLVNTRGTSDLFKSLVQLGKLDSKTGALLSNSKNGDVLQNILVMLNGSSGSQTGNLVSEILGGIQSDKVQNLAGLGSIVGVIATLVPVLAATNPQVAIALVAANALLPYLIPILQNVTSGMSGPLGQVLSAFLKDENLVENIKKLIAALQGGGGGGGRNKSQLAMMSILPSVQEMLSNMTKSDSNGRPYLSLLNQALSNPNLMNLITNIGKKGSGSKDIELFATYLGPLIQGLAGDNSAKISQLFNALIKNGGIMALKNFGKDSKDVSKFAALLPFIESIIRGLNSTDTQSLAKIIIPLLNTKDPAGAISNFVTSTIKKDPTRAAQLLTIIFPNLGNLAKEAVPGKQMLSAQLVQGIINGGFKNLKVVRDLPGTSGVILSGTARDIFTLAQLPNVSQVISLGGNN